MADDRLRTADSDRFYMQMTALEREALEQIGAFDSLADLDEEAAHEEIQGGEEPAV